MAFQVSRSIEQQGDNPETSRGATVPASPISRSFRHNSQDVHKDAWQQGADEVVTQDAAVSQSMQRFAGEFLQRSLRAVHMPKGKSEALFLLGDDFVGQETAQRLLEEPAQLQAL